MSPGPAGGPGGSGRLTVVLITLIGIVTAGVMLASVLLSRGEPRSEAPLTSVVRVP